MNFMGHSASPLQLLAPVSGKNVVDRRPMRAMAIAKARCISRREKSTSSQQFGEYAVQIS